MAKAKKDWTPAEFFKAWQGAETLEQAMKALGATAFQEVTVRAAFYRKHGIPLKDFPKKKPVAKAFDYDGAIAAFAKVTGEKVATVKAEGQKVKAEAIQKAKASKAKKKEE